MAKLQIYAIVLRSEFNKEYGNSDITFHDLDTKRELRVSWKDGEFPDDPVQALIPRDYILDGVQVFNGHSAKGSYTQISCTGLHGTERALQPAPRPNGKAAQPEKA